MFHLPRAAAASLALLALAACSPERRAGVEQSVKSAHEAASEAVTNAANKAGSAVVAGDRAAGEGFDAAGRRIDGTLHGTPATAP